MRWLKVTAPVPLVVGVVVLQGDGALWELVAGVVLLAWGLAFIQDPGRM